MGRFNRLKSKSCLLYLWLVFRLESHRVLLVLQMFLIVGVMPRIQMKCLTYFYEQKKWIIHSIYLQNDPLHHIYIYTSSRTIVTQSSNETIFFAFFFDSLSFFLRFFVLFYINKFCTYLLPRWNVDLISLVLLLLFDFVFIDEPFVRTLLVESNEDVDGGLDNVESSRNSSTSSNDPLNSSRCCDVGSRSNRTNDEFVSDLIVSESGVFSLRSIDKD